MDTNIFKQSGSGPNIIFLHGWKQDRHTWDGIVDQLSADFRCFAVDLPGFGQNPLPNKAWNPADYAKWVGNFITQHRLEKPVVVGHSFGSRVALELAAHDEHVSKLVLYAVPGVRQPLSKFRSITQAFSSALKKPGNNSHNWFVDAVRARLRSKDYASAGELEQIFLATINFDLAPSMRLIKQPTLLVWGEHDTEVPLKIAHAMQSIIKGSELKIIPTSDHFAHLQNPRLFAGMIREFING